MIGIIIHFIVFAAAVLSTIYLITRIVESAVAKRNVELTWSSVLVACLWALEHVL